MGFDDNAKGGQGTRGHSRSL